MTDEKKGGKEQGDGAHGYGFVTSLEIPRNESYVSMSCPATTSPRQKEINTFPSKHNSAATWGRRIIVDGVYGVHHCRWGTKPKMAWGEKVELKGRIREKDSREDGKCRRETG